MQLGQYVLVTSYDEGASPLGVLTSNDDARHQLNASSVERASSLSIHSFNSLSNLNKGNLSLQQSVAQVLIYLSVLLFSFWKTKLCFSVILLRSVLQYIWTSFVQSSFLFLVLKLIILWQNSIHQCFSIINIIIIVYTSPAASSLDGVF